MAVARNPILNHTLDEDLDDIREFSELFKKLPADIREKLKVYIYDNQTLEYYHGCYVSFYQAYVIADMAKSDLAESLQWLVWTASAKIVSVLGSAKKEIKNAKVINEINHSRLLDS